MALSDQQPIKYNFVITFWCVCRESKIYFSRNFEAELFKIVGAQKLFEAASTLVTPLKIHMIKCGFEKEIHEE